MATRPKVRCCCTLFLALGHMRVQVRRNSGLGHAHGAHGLVGWGVRPGMQAGKLPRTSDGRGDLPGRGPTASASYLFRYWLETLGRERVGQRVSHVLPPFCNFQRGRSLGSLLWALHLSHHLWCLLNHQVSHCPEEGALGACLLLLCSQTRGQFTPAHPFQHLPRVHQGLGHTQLSSAHRPRDNISNLLLVTCPSTQKELSPSNQSSCLSSPSIFLCIC